MSLSNEIHALKDDDIDTGNSSLLSRSDGDSIMDIFVILAYKNTLSITALLLYSRQRTLRQGKTIFNRKYITPQALLS